MTEDLREKEKERFEAADQAVDACVSKVWLAIETNDLPKARAAADAAIGGAPQDERDALSVLLLARVEMAYCATDSAKSASAALENRTAEWGKPYLAAAARLIEQEGLAAAQRLSGSNEEPSKPSDTLLGGRAAAEFERSLGRRFPWRAQMEPMWGSLAPGALAGWVLSQAKQCRVKKSFNTGVWADAWIALWSQDEKAAGETMRGTAESDQFGVVFHKELARAALEMAERAGEEADDALRAQARQRAGRLAVLGWIQAERCVSAANARPADQSSMSLFEEMVQETIDLWRSALSQPWPKADGEDALSAAVSTEESAQRLGEALQASMKSSPSLSWKQRLAQWMSHVPLRTDEKFGRGLLLACESGVHGEVWQEIALQALPVTAIRAAGENKKASVLWAQETLARLADAGGLGERWGWASACESKINSVFRMKNQKMSTPSAVLIRDLDGWSLERVEEERQRAWRAALDLPSSPLPKFVDPRWMDEEFDSSRSETAWLAEILKHEIDERLSEKNKEHFWLMAQHLERRGWSLFAEKDGANFVERLKEVASAFQNTTNKDASGHWELVASLERRALSESLGETARNGEKTTSPGEAPAVSRGTPRL
jgi:hypothetical protein